jgi:hypothetical protein
MKAVIFTMALLMLFACSNDSDEDNDNDGYNNDGYNEGNNNGNSSNSGNSNNNSYCGGVAYNPSTQFCSGSQIFSKCNGKEYNLTTQHCTDGILYTNFTDARDGQTYKSVEIGSQIWMAENLNYKVSGSYCYKDVASNCVTYGSLYDWATAMALASSYNSTAYGTSTRHKGVCPTGWHLPSDAEWEELRYFAALPGGYYIPNSGSADVGDYGVWWTATEYDAKHSRSNAMIENESSIFRYGDDKFDYSLEKSRKLSVRCVKDY